MNPNDVNSAIGVLTQISTFLAAPPTAVVIACAWILSPVMSFIGIQRIKKYQPLSAGQTQMLAIAVSFGLALVVMVGLYHVGPRIACIHAGLIAWCYPAAIKWLMEWAERSRPSLYDALRSGTTVSKDAGEKPDPNDQTYY